MKKYKLGELLDVTRGASLSGEYYSTEGEFLRLTLGNFDYQNGGFKENTSKDDLFFTGTVKPQFILNEGDIITPLTEQTQGLIGSTARIPQSGVYIQSQDVGLVKCNGELLDPDFCYYLLPSQIVKKQLSAGAQQTKIRHTSPDKIKDVTVFLPELSEQRKIGHILRSIDSQIDNLTAINRNLEQLARQLYDYWFVQFDFPNDEGKPYKSSGGEMVWNEKLKRCIPKDCLLKKIGEILDKVPKSIRLSTKEYNAKGDFPIVDQSSDKYIVGYTDEETAVVKKYPAILFGDHSCVVKYLNFEFCRGADGTQILYSANTRIPLEYLYFAVKDIKFKEGYARHYSILKDNLIIVPEEKVAAGFEIRVKPIFNSIKDNIFEIISLQRLLDELLPMLLNGQVSVYDIKSYDFMPEDIQMAAEP